MATEQTTTDATAAAAGPKNTGPAKGKARKTPSAKGEVRTQHVLDPDTGEKVPFQIRIKKGGGRRPA